MTHDTYPESLGGKSVSAGATLDELSKAYGQAVAGRNSGAVRAVLQACKERMDMVDEPEATALRTLGAVAASFDMITHPGFLGSAR